MFAAINERDKSQTKKLARIEKELILKTYKYALEIEKLDLLDGYVLENEDNTSILRTCKDYLTRNKFVSLPYKMVVRYLKEEYVKNSQFLFLEILEYVIDQHDFIRAKKMIVHCKTKEFYSYKFFMLKKRFKAERKVIRKIDDISVR